MFVHSCYESTGAYTHHDTDVNLYGLYSIASSLLTAAELANQTFKVPYKFVSKQVKEPPRNSYWTSPVVLLLCIVLYGSLVIQSGFDIIKQRHKTGIMSTVNRTVLTTTEAGSRALSLFDSDGTTFVVDNVANTSVCNDSRLFIGPLIEYNVTLNTANVNRGLSLKNGPICMSWEDDSGETLTYDFKDVL